MKTRTVTVPARVSRVISSRQQAYLDAMDIGVWQLRKTANAAEPVPINTPGLKLGPGGGGILLVCTTDTDSASRLAGDIGRSLGSVPVWAWPDTDHSTVNLIAAIEENLFTTVAIFGDALAAQFFNRELPPDLSSAKLVLLPAMQDIKTRAGARQALWSTLCRSGMVSQN